MPGGDGGQDRAAVVRQDGLSAVQRFCSANLKLHLQTVIYCQGQGSLLTGPLISWLMDLSTIGIYCCRHHFNVCMINSSINTENIPPSSYGGFVWAYVPIRPIMVRSNRAYSMGATECRQRVCLIPSMWERHAFLRRYGLEWQLELVLSFTLPLDVDNKEVKNTIAVCHVNIYTLSCMLCYHSSLIQ